MKSQETKRPFVTIAIPAFNHEGYIKEAIESVLAQDFKDWELIIIDDGSTDATPEIIDSYEDQPKIRIFHQQNMGLSPTLNRAVTLAKGEFFNFLPSDDYFHVSKLSKQVQVLRQRPESICIFSDQIPVDANGKVIDKNLEIQKWHRVPFEDERHILPNLFERNFIPAPSALIRIDSLKAVGGFDESLIYTQDYDLWMRLLPTGKAFWLHEPLLYYRWHGENLTYKAEEAVNFERAYVLIKALYRLRIEDIYPELKKDLGEKATRERAVKYVRLTEHLIRSGLIELLPWCRLFLNRARQLDPSLKIPQLLLKKIEQRQGFLDLRDERLLDLSKKLAITEGELAGFKIHIENVPNLVKLKAELERYRQEVPDILAERRELREESKRLNHEYEKLHREYKRLADREKELDEWNSSLDEKLKWLEGYQRDLEERERFLNRRFVRCTLRLCSLFARGGRNLIGMAQQLWHLLPLGIRAKYGPKLKAKLLSSMDQPGGTVKSPGTGHGKKTIRGEAPHDVEREKNIGEKPLSLDPCLIHRPPLITVVLPIYNHAASARLAVESILNQTYPNIQIVIVDDGSTDDLQQVLAPYIGRKNITFLTQENQKLPGALTNGFRFAKGVFYSWTSADNIMLPWQIETLACFLFKRPDVDLTYGNVEVIGEDGQPLTDSDYRIQNQVSKGSSILNLPSEIKALDAVPDNFINAAFMYRQDVAQALGPYDPRLLGTEDYDYWLRTKELFNIEKCDSDKVLYQYRVHKNSLSGRYGDTHICHNVKKLIEDHRYRRQYYREKFLTLILSRDVLDKSKSPLFSLAEGLQEEGCGFRVVIPEDIEFHGKLVLPHVSISSYRANLMQNTGGKVFILTDWIEGLSKLTDGLTEKLDIWCGLLSKHGDSPPAHLKESMSLRKLLLDDHTTFNDLSILQKEDTILVPIPLCGPDLLRKAREDKFPIWQFPWQGGHILLSIDSLDAVDEDLVSETADAFKEVDLVFASQDKKDKKRHGHLFNRTNIHFFHFDSLEQLYPLAGAVSALWMPVQETYSITDITHKYAYSLTIAKPFLAPDSLRYSPEAPYWFGLCQDRKIHSIIEKALKCKPDKTTCDAYLDKHSPGALARFLFAAANNDLFIDKKCGGKKAFFPKPPTPLRPSKDRRAIALEINSLDKGGLEEVVFNLASQFDKNMYDVTITCAKDGGLMAENAQRQGLDVQVFKGDLETYENFLKQRKICLINSHYCDFSLDLTEKLDIPIVATIHNAYVWFDKAQRQDFIRKDKYIAHYIAVSSSVREYLTKVLTIPKDKITVIPNGVDTVLLKLVSQIPPSITRSKLGLSERDFVFLNPASIDGRKNHHIMISALSRILETYPEARILCAGNVMDPTYFQGLKQRIAESGLEEKILFPGFIKEKADLYRLADCLLMPSIVEGWSIAKTEALYFGLPVILTDVGGAADVLTEDWIGILVPNSFGSITNVKGENLGIYTQETRADNLDPLVEAMEDMLERRDFWRSHGPKRRKLVEEKYNVEQMIRKTTKTFMEILEQRL